MICIRHPTLLYDSLQQSPCSPQWVRLQLRGQNTRDPTRGHSIDYRFEYTYLAAFAGMYTVVEAGSFVTTHSAQYGGSVKLWKRKEEKKHTKKVNILLQFTRVQRPGVNERDILSKESRMEVHRKTTSMEVSRNLMSEYLTDQRLSVPRGR